MSPELKEIYYDEVKEVNFNPDKSDIFSLGITFCKIFLIKQRFYFRIK